MGSLRHFSNKKFPSPIGNTLNLKTDIETLTNKLRTFEYFNNANG